MQGLLLAILLSAAPSPKTVLVLGPVRLLEVSSEKPVPLLPKGAEVVVVVEGSAMVSVAPGTDDALGAGESVYLPAPPPWTVVPRPRVRAVILAMPTPKGADTAVHRTEKDSARYRLLGGQGEVVLVLDKAVVGTDAFSQSRLTLQPGAAVPPHNHPGSAELIYVISGQSEVTVTGVTKTLRPGEAIAIPAGAQHSAKVVGKEPLQVIQFYVPGGPEQRFRTSTTPAQGATGGRGDAGVTSAATPR